MKVSISTTCPSAWKTTKPIRSYDTNFLYIGVERYDVATKTLSSFTSDGEYTQRPCTDTSFSSSYANEPVRITIYSEAPRMWSEELSPHDVFFFTQQS